MSSKAQQTFFQSAELILHGLEQVAHKVHGVADLYAILEVAYHLNNALESARVGDWDEFGKASLEMSNAAVTCATFGAWGAIMAISNYATGSEVTISEVQEHALERMQDSLSDLIFETLRVDVALDSEAHNLATASAEIPMHASLFEIAQSWESHVPTFVLPDMILTPHLHGHHHSQTHGHHHLGSVDQDQLQGTINYSPHDYGHSQHENMAAADLTALHFLHDGGTGVETLIGGHHYVVDVQTHNIAISDSSIGMDLMPNFHSHH